MGREREAFLSMSRALIDNSWREVKTCLEVVPKALQQVDENQTGRFLKLGERLAKVGMRDTSRFLSDGSQALSRVSQGSQGYILDQCETLLVICSQAVPATGEQVEWKNPECSILVYSTSRPAGRRASAGSAASRPRPMRSARHRRPGHR